MTATVYLVGAGPGDPELLTVKATRLLQSAEAVLYDDLVAPQILRLAPPTARLHNVGKRCGTKRIRQEEINFLMIALATSGLSVVRLKSGDPMMFGRAGEEIEALRTAGVPYEIVPGVTSALAAAAAAAIPLTHRRISSTVIFLTAHQASGSEEANWKKFAGSGSTLVIYMPGRDYAGLADRLRSAGLSEATPCAIVSHVTTEQEQFYRTTIQNLPDAPSLAAPSLLIVGDVVGLANRERLHSGFSLSQWTRSLLPPPEEMWVAPAKLTGDRR
ncbi:MAG TPA: uroporphyrinogen-III C-methyltransferase [Candidatus Sulfotelmatobacter sp.]